MKRKIVAISSDCIQDLPKPCRGCFYWESAPHCETHQDKEAAQLKAEWFQETLSDRGECGRILYQGGQVLAYAQYGPGSYFPRTRSYLTGDISGDAAFLSCLYVVEEVRGKGIGRIMLRGIEKDLYKKGFRALETLVGKTEKKHVGPMDFYLKNGFFIHKQDLHFPLLRIEFRSIVTWPVSLQTALDALTITHPEKAPAPT